MLNLSEFEVIKREENEYYYKFTIIAKDRPFVCTQCLWDETPILGDNKRFTIHSSKERQIHDIPIHGKPVVLILKHNRYKCHYLSPYISLELEYQICQCLYLLS